MVEAEAATFIAQYADHTLGNSRQAVVRSGYLPERTVLTGISDVAAQAFKVRDHSSSVIFFNSALLLPYE